MRYPWVCLTICGIWAATVTLVMANVVDPGLMYIYASVTVLILFFLGFARG